MIDLQEAIASAKSRFDREAAFGFSATFQMVLSDGGDYYLVIDQGEATYHYGVCEDADITLLMNYETFLSVLSGSLDGMQAFTFGQVKVEGDLRLAQKLLDLFPYKNTN